MPALITSVVAPIDFLDPALPLKEKPFSSLVAPSNGSPATNIESYPVDVTITDLRSVEDYLQEFTTESSGFQIVNHASAHLEDIDTDEGKQAYFKEMEDLLLASLPGSTRAKVFNSTIRRKKHNAVSSAGAARTPENTGPVSRAHNDNTPTTGARRVTLEMGEEAEELSKGRCQIINIWRPLSYPAQDCPLAAMDYRTLDQKDLIPTDLILSNEGNRKGENYSVLHNPNQKWYYLSDQRPDEPIIFKIYDSLVQDGVSQLTPHSAFVNPLAPEDAPSRQSIELRALVFY